MKNMQMDQYTHNGFWLENRITVTLQLTFESIPDDAVISLENTPQDKRMIMKRGSPPTFDKRSIIAALNFEAMNNFLKNNNYPVLKTIDFTDTLRTPGVMPPDVEQIGKYLFTSIDERGRYVPTVICFFKFDSMPTTSPAAADQAASTSSMTSMQGSGSVDDKSHNGNESSDPVVRLVNFINKPRNQDFIKNTLHVSIALASPTWPLGGSSFVPVGCPLSPPIPVPGNAYCSSSPGLWPITLPELPSELERSTGDGVHIIILDTLPRQEEIRRSIEGAEEHNLLLLDVANNVVMHHNQLPAQIDEPGPFQPKTGKDIKGRNGGGFRMADHGMFIAGIVRDVAPDAHVECIRTLNDFCAGDSTAFVKILEGIQNRMLLINPDDNNNQGDLFGKPVVINLSCVIPPDDVLKDQGITDPSTVRAEIYQPIKDLVHQGALFVASAGNEGDTRYQPSNPTHVRPDALYPAQFAYTGVAGYPALGNSIIPVGAVDQHGNPTTYSCYPGDLGIATYGGDVPKHFKHDASGCFTEAEDIDALIGIYTALSYPALLLEDCRPTYPVPNAHAWAYWSGTSFATPIITGLVARILQSKLENPLITAPPNISLPQTLVNVGAVQNIAWDRLGPADPGFHTASGKMIVAVQQCAPNDRDDDVEKHERVDVHVTINERD